MGQFPTSSLPMTIFKILRKIIMQPFINSQLCGVCLGPLAALPIAHRPQELEVWRVNLEHLILRETLTNGSLSWEEWSWKRKVWKEHLMRNNKWSWGRLAQKREDPQVYKVAMMRRDPWGPLQAIELPISGMGCLGTWWARSTASVKWGLDANLQRRSECLTLSKLANICWESTIKQALLCGGYSRRYEREQLFTLR